jgi:uncharacterized protein YfeS
MEEENFELEPHKAHPQAQKILIEEFYWDPTEEAAPFGSDDGHDAFYGFLAWRKENKDAKPFQYVQELIDEWGFDNEHYRETNPKKIEALVEEDEFGFFSRDNALIAICFGQLVLEGKVDPEIKELALIALDRQKHPAAMNAFREDYHPRRQEILEKMNDDLTKMK